MTAAADGGGGGGCGDGCYCVVLGCFNFYWSILSKHTFFVAMYRSTIRCLTFREGSAGNVGPFPAMTPTISSRMLLAAKWLNGKNISTAYLAAMSSRTLREQKKKEQASAAASL